MRRIARIAMIAWAVPIAAASQNAVLVDFASRQADAPAIADFMIRFHPSGAVADASSFVRETMVEVRDAWVLRLDVPGTHVPVLEAVIDFARAPDGTTSAVILPPSLVSGSGILERVAALRSVEIAFKAETRGGAFGIVLADELGQERLYWLGVSPRPGWRRDTMINPQYLADVRDAERRLKPYLPESNPFLRFAGFIVQRPGEDPDAVVVVQIKDVKLSFDSTGGDPDLAEQLRRLWGSAPD